LDSQPKHAIASCYCLSANTNKDLAIPLISNIFRFLLFISIKVLTLFTQNKP